LGLIALAYGLALLAHAYGFLAVFMAGLALRHVEMRASGTEPPADVLAAAQAGAADEIATCRETAHAYMVQAVLGFNEQLERIGAAGVVVIVGGLLSFQYLTPEAFWFVPALLLLVRPTAVGFGLLGSGTLPIQRRLIAWFGIRGLGSLYYLMFAIQHGLPPHLASRLTGLTLTTIAVSVVVHGLSVTPLMEFYERQMERRSRRRAAA
jgi:sodium/hydrogen antiporter